MLKDAFCKLLERIFGGIAVACSQMPMPRNGSNCPKTALSYSMAGEETDKEGFEIAHFDTIDIDFT